MSIPNSRTHGTATTASDSHTTAQQDPQPIGPAPLASPARRGLAGGLVLLVLALLAAVVATDLAPPSPRPASAPASEFSAARAASHLERFASQPHPIGTKANDRARDYLLGALRDLGLSPEVHTALGESPVGSQTDGVAALGWVRNVVAVLPGEDATGRVFVVAHYDSAPNSPGASDDGAAVAAILETARALRTGAPLRNDVVFLFTDGEEPGLLGAEAFVRTHPLARDGGVVLNWEASGSHGPSAMFETSQGNARLIETFAAAPRPYGDSATVQIYRMSTHNTDLTVFLEAGFAGLNSAFTRGSTDYHTPQDSIANLSHASLQHHGVNMLALTRTLGDADLDQLTSGDAGDVVFFSAFGTVVRYPAWLALPLAVLAVLGVAALVAVARRRRMLTLPRTLAGVAAALLPLVLAPLAAQGLWSALVALRPGYADLGMGVPYRPELYRLALVALTATVVIGSYAALRRRLGPTALALGALVWPALLGALAGWAAPGASYLLVLPTLGMAAGGLVALAVGDPSSSWRVAALTAGAALTVFMLPALVWELGASVGIAGGAQLAFLLALLGLVLLPLVELAFPPPRPAGAAARPTADRPRGGLARLARVVRARGVVLTGGVMLLAAALTVAGLVVDRFDAAHPRPAQLLYALDTDTGTATWISADQQPSAWIREHVTGPAAAGGPVAEAFPPVGPNEPLRTGPASAAVLPAPELTVLDERVAGNERTVRLLVQSAREAPVISLYADQPVEHATVAGHPLAEAEEELPAGPWRFGVDLHAPPTAGAEVTLRLPAAQEVQVRVVDHSYGLTGLPGFTPRPASDSSSMAHSDQVMVGRTFTL